MRARIYQTHHKNQKDAALPFWLALIVSFLAGLSFVLALAPYGVWGVALLSPLLLYALLLSAKRPLQAFFVGWAYGFGLWATGAFWLYHSVAQYGGVPPLAALLLIGLLAAAMGLFHAGLGWIFVGFLGRQPLAFAALWTAQEWLKTWFLSGFPWLFVGYAYTDLPFVASLAPLVGVLGVGFVSVLLSAALVDIFRSKAGYALIASAPLVLGVVLWLVDPSWTQAEGDPLRVSLVQGNIDQRIKWDDRFQNDILDTYTRLSAKEWGSDLVVWPEAAVPTFYDEEQGFLQALSSYAKSQDAAFVTGIAYRDWQNFRPDRDAYPDFYNAVMAFGTTDGLYKKQKLVPFGEYIPFEGALDLLPNLAGNHDVASYSRGDAYQPLINVKNRPMGVAICYEVAYPETVRQNAKNSRFLLTVSNDAWFGASAGPHQHLQMAQMRSLENGRWFVRATNNGITAVIDHKGRAIAKAPQFTQTVLQASAQMRAGQTPFARFGHYPILALVVVLLILSAVAAKDRRYFAKDRRFYSDYR